MLPSFVCLLAFLLGFTFTHRDDLEIVADRFQNKCFVDGAGRICGAVAQLVSERKSHLYAIPALVFDGDIAGHPKLTSRPAGIVALQIGPDLFPILHAFIVVLNAIGEERRLGAHLRIEPGEYKRADIIAQTFLANV